MSSPVIIHHNLDPAAFKWLWAKYAVSPNLSKHCTASLKALAIRDAAGRGSVYSRKFSGVSNPRMRDTPTLLMDEVGSSPFAAIYLCGVAAAGYSQRRNYPHNLHAAIVPAPGRTDRYLFENWELRVENGLFTRIPAQEELPDDLQKLPPAYVTCRIFRWAACILPQLMEGSPDQNLWLNGGDQHGQPHD